MEMKSIPHQDLHRLYHCQGNLLDMARMTKTHLGSCCILLQESRDLTNTHLEKTHKSIY